MAIKLNAHLTIVHPYRLDQLKKKEDMVLVKKNIDIDATKNFENIAIELFRNGAVSYDFHAEVGFIQDRVQEYSRKKDILFIVLGKNLASNKETIGELIEQIEMPLVIIPDHLSPDSYQRSA